MLIMPQVKGEDIIMIEGNITSQGHSEYLLRPLQKQLLCLYFTEESEVIFSV